MGLSSARSTAAAQSNRVVPWRLVIATHNRLIHGYLGIDNDTSRSIIVSDVPALLAVYGR